MTNWIHLQAIPPEARLVRRGLDFGYTNDPTAIVDVYEYNGGYVWVLVAYTKGLSNAQIAKIILDQPEQVLVIGDSSEPKSIDEIKGYGVPIIGAVKGADSVLNGVGTVQSQQVYVLEQDTDLIKEERNYLWKLDRDGQPLNVPRDLFNHAMDAGRYAMTDLIVKRVEPIDDYEDTDDESEFAGLMDESF
jgi:phage terminase large subunit